MLHWAREWRGRSIEDAAKKVNKKPADIIAWESAENPAVPTVVQARTLATYYDRAFLEFFLPEPPRVPVPQEISDFRTYRGEPTPERGWELTDLRARIERRRRNALELFEELDEPIPRIPQEVISRIDEAPDVAAGRARKAIGFTVESQTGLTSKDVHTLPDIIRAALERNGILVFREGLLKRLRVRGICIAAQPLPTIVYTNESPTAQAFTLGHEFAHILLGESGITGFERDAYESQPVERWCDRFAAAFLMPSSLMTSLFGEVPSVPQKDLNDESLSRFSKTIRVSEHALLIRLVHLGYVASAFYWDVKKPQFDSLEAKYKSFGRTKVFATRFKTKHGDLYSGLVMDAWSQAKITGHSAAEYMGIKSFTHLNALRAAMAKR